MIAHEKNKGLYMLFDGSKKKVKTELIKMTPELAADYLKKNTSNRPLRKSGIDYISGIITRGEWIVTHQGIAIDENDLLIDGQHRLNGIIKSGVAVEILVTTGLPKESYQAIDGQISRNLTDKSGIPKKHAEVINFLMNNFEGISKPTPQQALITYGYLGSYIQELHDYCSANTKFFTSVGFRSAAVISLILNNDKAFVLDAYRNLSNGDVSMLSKSASDLVKRFIKGNLIDKSITIGFGGVFQKDVFKKALFIFDKANAYKTFNSFKGGYLDFELAKKEYLKLLQKEANE